MRDNTRINEARVILYLYTLNVRFFTSIIFDPLRLSVSLTYITHVLVRVVVTRAHAQWNRRCSVERLATLPRQRAQHQRAFRLSTTSAVRRTTTHLQRDGTAYERHVTPNTIENDDRVKEDLPNYSYP